MEEGGDSGAFHVTKAQKGFQIPLLFFDVREKTKKGGWNFRPAMNVLRSFAMAISLLSAPSIERWKASGNDAQSIRARSLRRHDDRAQLHGVHAFVHSGLDKESLQLHFVGIVAKKMATIPSLLLFHNLAHSTS